MYAENMAIRGFSPVFGGMIEELPRIIEMIQNFVSPACKFEGQENASYIFDTGACPIKRSKVNTFKKTANSHIPNPSRMIKIRAT